MACDVSLPQFPFKLAWPGTAPLSLAEAATSIIFVATKGVFCCNSHDKSMLVTTKHLSRQIFVITKALSQQQQQNHTFVMTSILLSCQKTCFVMTSILLSCQKTSFVMTIVFCCDKYVFCHDKSVCGNKLLSWQKWYMWQLLPTIHLSPVQPVWHIQPVGLEAGKKKIWNMNDC